MKKQRVPKGAEDITSQDAISDPRFASFSTDPRFRLPSKKQSRTKIDKRFSRMLKDDDFTNTAKVDRYGRKLSSAGKKKALQRLYQPEENDSEEDDEANVEIEDDNVVKKELKKANAGYDPARGGGFSSSDEDEDEDEEDGGAEVEEEDAAEFPNLKEDQLSVPMGEVTSRIAVVNLDWDNIRAVDLMAVFVSFARTGGHIKGVTIYPSEFGKERMERELIEGPPKELFAKKTQEGGENYSEDENEDEEEVEEKIKKDLLKEDDGREYNSAALRKYQVERLRYYYAVMVCSDKETAKQIYETTDGTEYLSSANSFDLRFVPDDVEFDEKPRDVCESVPSGYKPTEFVTDALQHSKVKLTWDAENTQRRNAINRAFSGKDDEISEDDLKAYIRSESSEDEEVETEEISEIPRLAKKEIARQKMRAALGLADETDPSVSKSKKFDQVSTIKITFNPGLSAAENGGVFVNKPIIEETTDQTYIRKEKERKARRKEKAKALREGIVLEEEDKPETKVLEITSAPEEPGVKWIDSFFTTDEAANEKSTTTKRKEIRKAQQEARLTTEKASAVERAKLELLMADERGAANSVTKAPSHFDIKEIIRTEKEHKRGKRGKRSKKGESAAEQEGDYGRKGLLQRDFQMDVKDPRFAAVYERYEYAIDPSNARFKATEGMRALLEEGRGRRKRQGEDEDGRDVAVDAEGGENRKEKRMRHDEYGEKKRGKEREELKGLVDNLKKNIKSR